jgi:DNA modification methylase
MNYITVAEAATEWDITERRVLVLCNAGRVTGAKKFGWSWAIPAGAQKPLDARLKDGTQLNELELSSHITLERVWAMPNSRTFEIKPIRELILAEMTDGLWIDPFANQNKLATITNDLNTEYNTDYHMDALDFLKMFDDNSVDGILYDPPYSPRQVSECYNNVGYSVTWDTTKASFWGNHKKEISRIVKPNGKVITFGWNSGGIGMKNGFEITRILMVPHGGWHNDTICTVEVKSKQPQHVIATNTEQLTLCEIETPKSKNSDTDIALIKKFDELPPNFWDFKNADTRELTHGLHNYPAVMVYPISRNILQIAKSLIPTEVLLDPFAGSGTVLVEGVIGGVSNVYGNDLNPLAHMMNVVKTTPIPCERLETAYNRLIMSIEFEFANLRAITSSADDYIINGLGLNVTAKDGWGVNAVEILNDYMSANGLELDIPNFKNIGFWYRPQVIIELQTIKNCIAELPESQEKLFFWLVFSEVTRTVSNRRNGEFKMYRMTADKIMKFQPDAKREFINISKRNVEKMSAFAKLCNASNLSPNVIMLSENTMGLNSVPDNSVDIMITSPPYGDSRTTVAYGEFSRLSLQWLDLAGISPTSITALDKSLMGGQKYRNGFEYTLDSDTLRKSLEIIKDSDIERAGDVFSFYHDLDKSIAAISRKMKSGAYQFWVVGNRTVKLENLQTDVILTELSHKYGLVHVHTVGRNIPNKVMPSLNSPTNETGKKVATMTNEHIVILRKV